MKKKTYTRPHTTLVRVAASQILAGSTIYAPESGNNDDLDTDDEGYGWGD